MFYISSWLSESLNDERSLIRILDFDSFYYIQTRLNPLSIDLEFRRRKEIGARSLILSACFVLSIVSCVQLSCFADKNASDAMAVSIYSPVFSFFSNLRLRRNGSSSSSSRTNLFEEEKEWCRVRAAAAGLFCLFGLSWPRSLETLKTAWRNLSLERSALVVYRTSAFFSRSLPRRRAVYLVPDSFVEPAIRRRRRRRQLYSRLC